MRAKNPAAGERGMALVIAVLVLFALSLLVTVMMASLAANRQMAGQSTTMRKALNTAEAGVGEAIAHLRNGDASMTPANPRSTAMIFLASAGSLPAVGADTTAIPTGQPTGQWLTYSTPDKSQDDLTIAYKTDASRSVIYRYDATKSPAIQTTSGVPIYEITSTGTAGNARTTIVTDVVPRPIYVNAKGAIAAGLDVSYVGNAVVCGRNHSANTPPGTGVNGRGSAPDCTPYETGVGDMPATWSTGAVSGGGASYQTGFPVDSLPNQTGFYGGPWDMLGMAQSDFVSFVGTPTMSPASLNGINYVDNDLVMGNQSASTAFHGVSGEGLLYIDGNLTLNAGFTYVGLVYVEGDLHLNGQAWILGGLVVRGKATVQVNGGATVLYSSDAITQKLAQYGGQYMTLSWREK